MGTSSSSTGSPSGVPIIPPWVPPLLLPVSTGDDQDNGFGPDDGRHEEGEENDGQQDHQPQAPVPAASVPIAPAGRFQPSRTHIGRFANTGSRDSLRRGIGHYVHKGLQGPGNAVQRFGGTTRTAGSLYNALSTLASGQAQPGTPLDRVILVGKTAQEVIAAIIEAVRPVDGTQDSEATRDAMQRAFAALLEQFPDADLVNLSEEQRLFAIERYLALDVFNRACLDLGKTIMDKAPSAASALSRMRDMRDYIRETVAAQFRRLRTAGEVLNARRVAELARNALREAFQVFEVDAT